MGQKKKKVLRHWWDYCEKLYYEEGRNTDFFETNGAVSQKMEPDILIEEVRRAIKSLKNGKSSGSYNVEAEILKRLGDNAISTIWKLSWREENSTAFKTERGIQQGEISCHYNSSIFTVSIL